MPQQETHLRTRKPQIIVACPGRLRALIEKGQKSDDPAGAPGRVKIFVIDEVDKVLEKVDMREDVQVMCSPQRYNRVKCWSSFPRGMSRTSSTKPRRPSKLCASAPRCHLRSRAPS